MHSLRYTCLCTLLLSGLSLNGQTMFGEMTSGMSAENRGTMLLSGGVFGQVDVSEDVDASRLRIELTDSARHVVAGTAYVSRSGSFEVSNAPPGMYELRVLTLNGEVVHQTVVNVPSQNSVRINLRGPKVATGAARRPISLARLQHKIPKAALKAYQKGKQEFEAGHREQAEANLEKAVALDPQFFEATNNLGVMYLQDGKLEQSYQAFHRAITIDPSEPMAESNLAYVLLKMQRFPEAEEAARASVRSDGGMPQGHFFLAVSLLEQRKARKEAIAHLSKVQETFTPARELLKRLHAEAKP